MMELFKFLMRIAIRVLIVITIGAWGASRIYDVSVVVNHSGRQFCASAESLGLSAQFSSSGIGWWPRLRIYVNEQTVQDSETPAYWKIHPDGQGTVAAGNTERVANIWGIQLWRHPLSGTRISVRYLTLMIALVILYALMRRRRNHVSSGSLRDRLRSRLREFRGT